MTSSRENVLRRAMFVIALILCGADSFGQTSTQPSVELPATQPGPTPSVPQIRSFRNIRRKRRRTRQPPYTLLRFNEDYHYLANPRNRTDPFDPLKYIPLNPDDPNSYLSLGGEIRERYEHYNNIGFGTFGAPPRDDYLLQRITLDADLHVNANLRFFVQGISGLQFGGEGSAPPVDQDPGDLQQAFADLKLADSPDSPDYLVIRGGRFEMTYGSGRLVATPAPNIPFKFDGLQLIWSAGGGKVYAFVTKPAREEKYTFDDEYPEQLFWGVYGTTPTLVRSIGLKADLYYFGYQNAQSAHAIGRGDEERQTFGTRLFGAAGGFDYDLEPVIQAGTFAGHDILAWTFASTAGYRFGNVPAKPRLGLDFDVASGDTKGGSFGTFNPLFFKAGYFNDASVIRPSNIIDIHPTLQLLPRNNVLLTLGSDTLWRYTTNDGVYGPPGNLEIRPGGSSRYVATTAEVSAQWEINRHLTWIASYTHFFTSDTIRQLGGKDVDFFGTWISFTW